MRLIHLSLALLLAALAAPVSAAPGNCLHYEQATTSLTGKVVLRTFYGPPNYGEDPKTDSREQQAILVLDKPVCTLEGKGPYDSAEQGVREATLIISDKVRSFVAFKGKRVRVEGEVSHAVTAHHHTPILIEARRIEALAP